ncbi:MAG: capsular polysaccharide biosynthesis protein [Clostridiales bacterium]|nr:capsular polysaccharide biosynthesis protein [Clostridiales bacterium]
MPQRDKKLRAATAMATAISISTAANIPMNMQPTKPKINEICLVKREADIMYTDYHSHILPDMDDGAKDLNTSVKMIEMLKNQGVDTVVSTSHYYAHKESTANFIERRKNSFDSLMSEKPALENIILGAEVAIERGISEKKGLEKLCIEGTKYILLELPYSSYSGWMGEEITNIQLDLGLTPIIAHINRYTNIYNSDQLDEVLSLPGVIFQINNEVFYSWLKTRFTMNLLKQGYPLVFGSDTHNTEERRPNIDIFEKTLKKKLKKDFDSFVKDYCSILKNR